MEELRPKAEFDLQCQELQFYPLAVYSGPSRAPSQIGVEGCDKSMSYVESPSGWVANTRVK